jgi:Holliday junction DNA helicase RuvA
MIAFIRGTVHSKTVASAIVESGGLGYTICSHERFIKSLELSDELVLIHTHLVIREDAHDLYGFMNKQEKELFLWLLKVNRVGPKVAMGIIGVLEPRELLNAITGNRPDVLKKAPGIGLKTSQRIILELREKLSKLSGMEDMGIQTESILSSNTVKEVKMALLALGYTEEEIKIGLDDYHLYDDPDELLTHALTKLSDL